MAEKEFKLNQFAIHLVTGETDIFYGDDADRAFKAIEIAVNTGTPWAEPFFYEEKNITMGYQMRNIVNYQIPVEVEEGKSDERS